MALELARNNDPRQRAGARLLLDRDQRRLPRQRDGQAAARACADGRAGELPELDGPLLLLASGAGSFMTGSIITVDGGHLLAMG